MMPISYLDDTMMEAYDPKKKKAVHKNLGQSQMITGGGYAAGSKSGINQSNLPMMGGITSGTGVNMMGMSE